MKAFKLITDPEAFQLIGDETRRRMIYLLRVKDMTVSQIAEELSKTPQAIYHHIRKLRDAGMIEVAREERVDHFIETYYRATAEVFNFSYGTGELGKEHARREVRQALESLPRLGIDVEFDDQTISELVDLQTRIDSLGSDKEFEARSAELEDVDFLVKQSVGKYARRMTMSDKEFEEFMRLTREFRNVLRSKLLKEVKA